MPDIDARDLIARLDECRTAYETATAMQCDDEYDAFGGALIDAYPALRAVVVAARVVSIWLQHQDFTHEQLCNGVHADNGMCEGDTINRRSFSELHAALAALSAPAGGEEARP